MKILVDLDSTLVDIMTPALNILNTKYNTNVTLADFNTWDCFTTVFPSSDVYKILQSKGFYKDLVKPITGSVEFLQTLQLNGHTIEIVSAGEDTLEKRQLIEKCFGSTVSRVVFARNKHLVEGDVLFDDRWETIYTWVRETDKLGLLYRHNDSYNYNDKLWQNPKFKRCNTYKDILKEIENV